MVGFSFGCAPDPKSEMERLAKAAKRTINPTNLQLWAVGILKTNSVHLEISKNLLPPDVQSLIGYRFQLEPSLIKSNRVHLVCWRTYKRFKYSVTCYYGICIGPQLFTPTKDTEVYTNWIPGLNFWYLQGVM